MISIILLACRCPPPPQPLRLSNGYRSPPYWNSDLDKMFKEFDDDVAPAAKRAKPLIPSDATIDHRPRADPPTHTCYRLERDCQYQDVERCIKRYRPAYYRLCEEMIRGHHTCLLGNCLKKPLQPFSITLSEANRHWSKDGPPTPTKYIWVEVGCKKHVKRVKRDALLLMTSRDLFDMYCNREIECSHRCHFAMCINLLHLLLEDGWTKIDRKDCAKRAERLGSSGAPIPKFCDKHDPPCLL